MVRATKVPLKTLTISLPHFVNTHFFPTIYLLNEKIDNAHVKKCVSYERINIAHVEHLQILLIGTLKRSKVSCSMGWNLERHSNSASLDYKNPTIKECQIPT